MTTPNALAKFLASMNITYVQWHDGDSYDLEALAQLTPLEKIAAEAALLTHRPQDWRDIQALALLDTPRAQKEIAQAQHSPDPKIRRQAAQHAGPLPDKDRETLLLRTLHSATIGHGLTEAIDEAAAFHPPKIIDALFHATLAANPESAVHYAALLFHLHGKSAVPFDWNHRPLFLKFNTPNPIARQAAFHELCTLLNINPAPYLHPKKV